MVASTSVIKEQHSNDAIIIMSARILLVDITIIRSPIEFIIGQ